MAYRHNVDLAIIDVPEETAVDTYKQQDANELVIVLVRARHSGKRGPPDQGLYHVLGSRLDPGRLPYQQRSGASRPYGSRRFRIECEEFEEV